jgi:alpha,alpha-trehalase
MKNLHIIIFFLNILSTVSQSSDQVYDELLKALQMQRVFNDSKAFCDAIPHYLTPNKILDLYRHEYNKPTFTLTSFVLHNLIMPNTTIIVHDKWTIEQHCHRLWPLLTGTTNENYSSFIDVPYSFIVPGGAFREFYYWDTYFTMLGLIRSNETQLIKNVLDNFAYLIRKIGLIVNGNRYYYEGRSRPPFFSLMTESVNKTDEYRNELELISPIYVYIHG